MGADQSRPASWIVPTGVAAGSGMIVAGLNQMALSESGMGVLLYAIPVAVSETVFVMASLIALMLMLAGRPLRKDPAARILVWALILVWLVVAVFGLIGSSAGASDVGMPDAPLRIGFSLCMAAATAAVAFLPSRTGSSR